jgi:peptide chain release factor subunit 1
MSLNEHLDRLAAFEPAPFPVISLYLNTQPDQHGRDNFDSFVRKEFSARAKTYPLRSSDRESFDRDTERINKYLQNDLRPSTNGLALFACAGADDFFEAVQLEAPVEEHRLYVTNQPHLYPLAHLNDQYPRYAALLADTNSARLFVFGLGELLDKQEVSSPKVNRTSVGGWSQARYQRHVDNVHLHHAKEVIEALDRLVREDKVEKIIMAGDEVIVPVLREQMPRHLDEKLIDVLRLDTATPEHQVLQATLETMREQDAKDDADRVKRLFGQYRAGGLAVVGAPDTLAALTAGQVDELVLSASLEQFHSDEQEVNKLLTDIAPVTGGNPSTSEPPGVIMADTLVTLAQQTGARVTFIEDPELLASVGGIGAFLRYRI